MDKERGVIVWIKYFIIAWLFYDVFISWIEWHLALDYKKDGLMKNLFYKHPHAYGILINMFYFQTA